MTGRMRTADPDAFVEAPLRAEAGARRVTPSRWFAASIHRRRVLNGTMATYEPWGVVHAREIGSLTSLCGTSSTSWNMFFDRSFTTVDPTSCPDCSAAARSMDAGRARRS